MLSGYSFKTSQYGLTVDNIARFELVLPNGTITNVTSKDEDLWFGLRVSGKARCRLVWLSTSTTGRDE
jgi:FAD/FMN-containing dehydrogenase